MAGNWNFCPVYCPPYLKRKVEPESFERQIYAATDMADHIVFFVLFTMIGSMVSGIILSRHVLSFLPISGGRAFARKLHMLSAYWGFALMSLHLGLHWSMIMGMAGRIFQDPSVAHRWVGVC